jgi:hypothetical protein
MAFVAALVGCFDADDSDPSKKPEPRAPKAKNLFITADDKQALLRAAVDACESEGVGDCVGMAGPLPGLYYGRRGNRFWALASFRHPVRDVKGQPLVLRRSAGGSWTVVARTDGTVAAFTRPHRRPTSARHRRLSMPTTS